MKKILEKLAAVADECDQLGLHKVATKIDNVLFALAEEGQPRAEAFYQYDPQTGQYRGIIEHVDELLSITFLPDAPIVSKDLNALKGQLEALVPNLTVSHKGVSKPWHPEANMPFDTSGNRLS